MNTGGLAAVLAATAISGEKKMKEIGLGGKGPEIRNEKAENESHCISHFGFTKQNMKLCESTRVV